MLVRKFICEEWEVTGELGWKPLWMKGMVDPTTGAGVAHDVLEHVCAKTSDADGELQALGAIVFNRLEGGAIHLMGGYYSDEYFVVRGLVYEVLENVAQYGQRITDPRNWRKLSDYDTVNSWIDQGVREGIESWVEDFRARFTDDEEGQNEATELLSRRGLEGTVELHRRICGWMTRGFRNTVRYYRNYTMDAVSVAYMYKELADQVNKIHLSKYEDEGSILTVRVDIRRAGVSCQVKRPLDDYEDEE